MSLHGKSIDDGVQAVTPVPAVVRETFTATGSASSGDSGILFLIAGCLVVVTFVLILNAVKNRGKNGLE